MPRKSGQHLGNLFWERFFIGTADDHIRPTTEQDTSAFDDKVSRSLAHRGLVASRALDDDGFEGITRGRCQSHKEPQSQHPLPAAVTITEGKKVERQNDADRTIHAR